MVSQAHHFLNPKGFEAPFIGKGDIKNAHIIPMIAYNNCRTNFAVSQMGELFCSYSITSGRSVNAASVSDECLHPPVIMKGRLRESSIGIIPENVRPICFKASAVENGWIIRIHECAEKDSVVSIDWKGKKISDAWICDLTENPVSQCDPAAVPISANQTLTVLLKTSESKK